MERPKLYIDNSDGVVDAMVAKSNHIIKLEKYATHLESELQKRFTEEEVKWAIAESLKTSSDFETITFVTGLSFIC